MAEVLRAAPPPRSALHTLLGMALATAVYYALARVGLLLAVGQSNATAIWPPSGFALALALRYGWRASPSIFIGAALANLTVFAQNQAATPAVIGAVSLGIAAGNTLEALLGAWLVQRFLNGELRMATPRNVYLFVFAIGAAALVACVNGTAELWISGIIQGGLAGKVATVWWIGDLLGMLVVAPMALMLMQSWRGLLARPRPAELLVLAITAISACAVFFDDFIPDGMHIPPYVLLLPMAWAAVWHRRGVMYLALAIVVAVAVPTTAMGYGPFDSGLLQHSVLDLCLFLAITTVIALVLATDNGSQPRFSPVPLLALAVCMTLSVITWEWGKASISRDAQERFDHSAQVVRDTLYERMEAYESLLRAGSALYEASNSVEHHEWRNFVTGLELPGQFPGVMGLGFANFLSAQDLDHAVSAIRRDDRPSFRIRPEGKREFYAPITLLEPETARNLSVIGFDMLAEPTRQRALLASMQNGRMTITAPLILAQNTSEDRSLGFLMVNPAYGPAEDGVSARHLLGFVYAPFRVKELMTGIFGTQLREVRLEVFFDRQNNKPMYVSELPEQGGSYLHLENVQTLLVGNNGQQWILRVTPTAAFDATIDQDKPFLLLMLGTTISLLFFGVSRNLVRERQLAQMETDASAERIREQQAILHLSETRFQLLTSAIKNHAIILLGPDGTISTWNEGAHKIFGYDEHEIVGQHVIRLHVDSTEREAVGLELALQRGQYENLGLRRRRDGSTFLGLAQTFPIRDDKGQCIGFAKIVRDVTDEKAAEKELNDAKTQAEAASAAKSAFVANISHELRTPMNAVLGLAQVLARTPLSADQRQYLDMISGAGKSLLALLNDVLDFSKIEANRLDLENEDYLLDDVIDAIGSFMTISGGDKHLDMAIRVDAEVPACLHGDAQRVQQVLLNLVSNAMKFTEQGSVCVHVRLDPVRPGHVRFDVADTGIGIEPAQMERLFTPFSQGDASMARKFGGTGLGLAISKRFAAMMDGVIEVQSRPGAGTTFSFSMPLNAGMLLDKYQLPHTMRGVRILYADPRQAARAAMTEMAKHWNSPCDFVTTADELALALSVSRKYGLILCDVSLALGAAKLVPAGAVFATVGRGTQAEAELHQPLTRVAIWHFLAGCEVNAGDAHGNAPAEPAQAPATDATLAGLLLLLAEDNPLNQVVAKSLLESAGARVELANTGEEALTALRRDASRFDLVLMDVQMPVMDGFTATRHIRQDLGLKLPIIAMSAGVTLDERAACQAAGMDDFVAKPVDRATLFSAIVRHVRRASTVTPPPARAPEAEPDVVFNVRHLEDLATRGLGSQSALVDMVTRALQHAGDTARQVRDDVAAGEYTKAARGLHNLRGTFGTLGARRVVQATQAAELPLLADPPRVPEPELAQVWQEMTQTESLARAWLARQTSMNNQ